LILLSRHSADAAGPAERSTVRSSVSGSPVIAALPAAPDAIRCQPGPWGELEYSRVLLEPPEEFIVSDYTKPEAVVWHFQGYSAAALDQLWDAAGLSPAQRREVDDPAQRDLTPGEITLRPSREFVIALSPAARTKIYGALAPFPANSSQNNPYRIPVSAARDWLIDSGLAPDTVALTEKMFYQRTPTGIFFSDDDIILSTLKTAHERVQFIKTLSRKSAILLQLRVPAGADVEAVARYWSRGRHAKDIKPLLQSLARRPAGGTIDVAHLLPHFARALLYTYPLPPTKANDDSHDCHWTSFNFFNDEADDRFSDINHVQSVLAASYYPVPGEPTFGDILMFVRPDGVVVHSCVYIADDIVFSKNGPAFSVPWLFGTLDGVREFYAVGTKVEIRRFRLRN